MILLKDYKTKQESFTFTATVITLFFALTVLVLAAMGIIKNEIIIWASVGLNLIYLAVYRNKRIRASSTGIEFGGKDE